MQHRVATYAEHFAVGELEHAADDFTAVRLRVPPKLAAHAIDFEFRSSHSVISNACVAACHLHVFSRDDSPECSSARFCFWPDSPVRGQPAHIALRSEHVVTRRSEMPMLVVSWVARFAARFEVLGEVSRCLLGRT